MNLRTLAKPVGKRLFSNPSKSITLSRVSGASLITGAAAEMMNMEQGDLIGFHQDTDNPKDWYMSFTDKGIPLRKSNEKVSTLYFSALHVAKEIFKSIDLKQDKAKFNIGEVPVKDGDVDMWPIITAKVLPLRN